MSMMSGLRVFALSALLTVAPVLPSISEAPPPAVNTENARDVEALFSQAMARPAIRAGAPPIDAAQLKAAFGEDATLAFTDVGKDPATGAHKLKDVKFILQGETPETLFTAKEALIWNFDVPALAARVKGERLDETLRVFDRVELIGVTMDLSEYTSAVSDAVNTALDDANGQQTEVSNLTVGTLALGGLTLHPWTFEEEEGQDEGIAAIRLLSAFARSVSLETALFVDGVNTQLTNDGTVSASVVSRYPRQLVHGYDRGKIGGMAQTSMTFNGTFNAAIPQTNETTEDVKMSGSAGYGAWTGADFSKLLEWGEKGEMPPITEQNLMAFGSYSLEDMAIELGGKPVIEIGRMEFSANKFSWFLPEEVRVAHEGVAIDLGAFLDIANSIEPEKDAEAALETDSPSLAEITAMLKKVGLSRIAGDGEFTFRWNPETGAATLQNSGTAEGLFSGITRLEGTLPSFAELMPVFGADGRSFNEEALDNLLMERAVLTKASTQLTDDGGFDTIAALTIELAKLGVLDDPMMANFANSTPETVRMFASGLVMLGSSSMTREFPEATKWASLVSQFITGGGTLEVSVAPKPELFQTPEATGGMAERAPGELADLLGISVRHTPASAAAETGAGTR